MKIQFYLFCLLSFLNPLYSQKLPPTVPRILISTDIGGTDPDDNQSMTHLLMYNNKFEIEGLVSSPSYGNGSKQEIIRMVDLYGQDLPKLQKHQSGFASPEYLRSISKQGYHGNVSFIGYSKPTEGSEWIVKCANKKSSKPLWILCWGGLEDLAQALHDSPDIQNKIRVYWIGGPNKKWSANSYAYIAANFPNLWFIENNSSYYGLFSHSDEPDSVKMSDYYNKFIQDKSSLGRDFINYYKGEVKMGDTPSLLYMMDGDPNNPGRESWGGSFEKFNFSPRTVINRTTTLKDSIAFCSIIEFRFSVPNIKAEKESIYFWMEVPYGKEVQKWPGYYIGNDVFAIRYIPKKAEVLNYKFSSSIEELNGKTGTLAVYNLWPGEKNENAYLLGDNWFTDRHDKDLYFGKIQGGKTVSKWREEILLDWAERWSWLNE